VKATINLTLKRKIIVLAMLAAVLPVAVMFILTVQFQGRIAKKAEAELDILSHVNVTQIAKDVYSLCETASTLLDRKVSSDMETARRILREEGGFGLAGDMVEWNALNQDTGQETVVNLKKVTVGGKWLGKTRDFAQNVPLVDDVARLNSSACTIFQRMNDRGDMLRVATTVEAADKSRAVGSYIPAQMQDGTTNPIIDSVLKGKPYRGLAFAAADWYVSVYEPIRDAGGNIAGMLFVGERLGAIETIRKSIMSIQVGRTGYVAVIGGKGSHRGTYIISYKGERDGENIIESKDADGRLFVKEMVDDALTHPAGEITTHSYMWKNPGENTPRKKIAVLSYFEPWDWVIFTTMYADDYAAAKRQIERETGVLRWKLLWEGFIILALVAGVALWIGSRMTRPLNLVTGLAGKIAAGNLREAREGLDLFSARYSERKIKYLPVDNRDETSQLIDVFRQMIDSLGSLIGQVQKSGIQVTALATEIAASAQQLQATVTEQAASTKEVTATSREISATANSLVRTMDDVADAVGETATTAENGKSILANNEAVMRQLMKAAGSISSKLSVISEKANKISTVGTTINKISDQTNLLSLNAAIEAEKAGEFGKGFSVVAREISRLADQTAVATQDIADMVKGMQSSVAAGVMEMDKFAEEVRHGVQEVDALGGQIGLIIDQVRSLEPQFDSVKDGMHAQEQAAQQISEAIGQLAVAADRTKESLHEFKTATEQATSAVQELQKEVSRFRLG